MKASATFPYTAKTLAALPETNDPVGNNKEIPKIKPSKMEALL